MRRIAAATCFTLVLAGQSVWAEEPEVGKKPSVWSKWFGKDKNVKTEEGDTQDKSKAVENDEAILLYQQASKRAQEQAEYFRRLEVCDKLMEIAIQRNDVTMQRQVEELQSRIQEVYNRKTQFLTSTAGKNDEVVIEKALSKSAKSPTESRSRFFAKDKPKDLDTAASASAAKKSTKEKDQ